MTAGTEMVRVVVKVVTRFLVKAKALVSAVASISCPSIGGTSLSAVSPDSDFERNTAVAF